MPKAGGYLVITEHDGAKREFETFTCCHCNTVVVLDETDPTLKGVGFCLRCDKRHCSRDQCRICVAFMKKVERAEEAAYRAAQRGY